MAAATSPLSSISTPTSTTSFYTANGSPSGGATTEASSPTVHHPSPYRLAKRLPYDLREHCRIYLEEQLYHCAIHLLNSLLSGSGLRRREPRSLVPPASHLALLGTLIIHPLHTTRATERERLEVSSRALDYLRNLLALVGPINADLRSAFQFHDSASSRRGGYRALDDDGGSSGGDENRDGDDIRSTLAGQNSLWHRASGFWTVVGWAFNCCTLHPHRWRYWRVWLEYMLDVLEGDWKERKRMDEEREVTPSRSPSQAYLQRRNSMIVAYVKQQNPRAGGLRLIIKAIFADGSKQCHLAFPEVFDKETKAKSAAVAGMKRRRDADKELDIANNKYGDYYDDESLSSGTSEPPTPQKPATRPADADLPTPVAESVPLRLRLFGLLSAASSACGSDIMPVSDLYETFATALNDAPLPLFRAMTSHHASPLVPAAQVSLLKELLHFLLPSSYRDPASVDRQADADGGATAAILELCYLPHPAGSIGPDDNAKVALLLENLTLVLWGADELPYSPGLRKAALKGVAAREAKARKKRGGGRGAASRGGGDGADAVAVAIMERSGQRLLRLVDLLEEEEEMKKSSNEDGSNGEDD